MEATKNNLLDGKAHITGKSSDFPSITFEMKIPKIVASQIGSYLNVQFCVTENLDNNEFYTPRDNQIFSKKKGEVSKIVSRLEQLTLDIYQECNLLITQHELDPENVKCFLPATHYVKMKAMFTLINFIGFLDWCFSVYNINTEIYNIANEMFEIAKNYFPTEMNQWDRKRKCMLLSDAELKGFVTGELPVSIASKTEQEEFQKKLAIYNEIREKNLFQTQPVVENEKVELLSNIMKNNILVNDEMKISKPEETKTPEPKLTIEEPKTETKTKIIKPKQVAPILIRNSNKRNNYVEEDEEEEIESPKIDTKSSKIESSKIDIKSTKIDTKPIKIEPFEDEIEPFVEQTKLMNDEIKSSKIETRSSGNESDEEVEEIKPSIVSSIKPSIVPIKSSNVPIKQSNIPTKPSNDEIESDEEEEEEVKVENSSSNIDDEIEDENEIVDEDKPDESEEEESDDEDIKEIERRLMAEKLRKAEEKRLKEEKKKQELEAEEKERLKREEKARMKREEERLKREEEEKRLKREEEKLKREEEERRMKRDDEKKKTKIVKKKEESEDEESEEEEEVIYKNKSVGRTRPTVVSSPPKKVIVSPSKKMPVKQNRSTSRSPTKVFHIGDGEEEVIKLENRLSPKPSEKTIVPQKKPIVVSAASPKQVRSRRNPNN